VRLNVEAHTFGEGKITKEATTSSEGTISFSCTECGFKKEDKLPKLTGTHKHEYTDTVVDATCTTGGYTKHECSCGHSWIDSETKSTDHSYVYMSAGDKHWKECTDCHTSTEKETHKLSEWNTVLKPGYTFSGIRERLCKMCGYKISEEVPKLTVPENKFVVTIPDYEADSVKPSGSTDDGKEDDDSTKDTSDDPKQDPDTSKPDVTDPDDPSDKDQDDTDKPSQTVKELLTKGDDKTVPSLPILPPTEDGNIFDGWVDKSTGEPVKKGDIITGNIEIEPVWKDCGDSKHTDKNDDNNCDECGYILVKDTPKPDESDKNDETEPSGKTDDPQDNTDPDDKSDDNPDDKPDEGGMPIWVIAVIGVFAAVVVTCGTILVVNTKKK